MPYKQFECEEILVKIAPKELYSFLPVLNNYRKGPKFLDRQVWVNSVYPDQTATDCHSVYICWRHYYVVKPHC